jgi:hypothetical protein
MSTILTVSQPASPYEQLFVLRKEVLHYYDAKHLLIPLPIAQMFPCVEDALEDGEIWYLELMYAMFYQVIEDVIIKKVVSI